MENCAPVAEVQFVDCQHVLYEDIIFKLLCLFKHLMNSEESIFELHYVNILKGCDWL